MLPPYLNDDRNVWVPVVAASLSIVSTVLYGLKSETGDWIVVFAFFVMIVGMGVIASMQNQNTHERIRFQNRASLIYMGVVFWYLFVGVFHTSTVVPVNVSAAILSLYCIGGIWTLLTIKSREMFESKDRRVVAFAAFTMIVFVFPITNASAYTNHFVVVLWHVVAYTGLYYMRLAYLLKFESVHPNWMLVQTMLGTTWLLDVPFVPSLPIYVFVFFWSGYKLWESNSKAESKTKVAVAEDPQSKIAALKPVVEPPRAKVIEHKRVPYAKLKSKPDPPIEPDIV